MCQKEVCHPYPGTGRTPHCLCTERPGLFQICGRAIILSETGVRISELCGFTTHLDFKSRAILVDHQLLRDAEIGFYIETPKTKSGVRQLHMSDKAYEAFQRILKQRGKVETVTVDATRISYSSIGMACPKLRPTIMHDKRACEEV